MNADDSVYCQNVGGFSFIFFGFYVGIRNRNCFLFYSFSLNNYSLLYF